MSGRLEILFADFQQLRQHKQREKQNCKQCHGYTPNLKRML
nr:MAG TPA: Diheme cytochrome c [Caudoviricetes sp.]